VNLQRIEDGDRLRRILDAKDMTQPELAARLSAITGEEVTRSIVANYISGRTRMSEAIRAQIAGALKVSVEEIWGVAARGGVSVGGTVTSNVARIEDASAFAMTAAIPRWRSASAGHQGGDSSFVQDGFKEVQVAFLVGGLSKIDQHAVVDVSGNSMTPRVNSGESLIIYKDEILYRNSIVLARAPSELGGDTFVKALRSVNNVWQLHSVNKEDGQDFENLEDWQIHGYAICRFGDDTEDEEFNVEWRNGRPLRAIRSLQG
jgi:transcriptional regulator with XRE-family HTH domain